MKGIKNCKYCRETFEIPTVHFLCSKDGFLHQEKVNFKCNKCDQKDLILKDGIYFCPECFVEADSYECQVCGSTEVSAIQNIDNNINNTL